MRPLVMSLPVRRMASTDKVTRLKPWLTIVKGAHGPLARCLRLTTVFVKTRFGWPFGITTSRLAGPPVSVTLKPQVERLPAASTAAQVTVVVPTGKVEPEGGVQVTVTPGRLSLTVGAG